MITLLCGSHYEQSLVWILASILSDEGLDEPRWVEIKKSKVVKVLKLLILN